MEKGKQLLEEMTAEEEAIGADIEPRLQALENEKAALGVFKIKERKALQEQIAALEEERSSKRAAFRNSTIQVDGTEMSRDESRRRFRTPLLYAEIARINKELEMERWGPVDKASTPRLMTIAKVAETGLVSGTIESGVVSQGETIVTQDGQAFVVHAIISTSEMGNTAHAGMDVSIMFKDDTGERATKNDFKVGDAIYLL